MEKYLRAGTLVFGIATIGLGIILWTVLPQKAEMRDGFFTPIMAFEFAQSEKDLAFLSNNDPNGPKNREMMDKAHNTWDSYFPVAYGGFLFFIILGLGFKYRKIIWIGLPFALMAIFFDLQENQSLLDITSALSKEEPLEGFLADLHLRTWLKWGAIAICLLFIAIGSIWAKEKVVAVLGISTAMMSLLCWISGSYPILAEVMGLMVTLFFLVVLITKVLSAWRELKE